MQCQQCGRNALYLFGPGNNIPLCIDCYGKLMAIEFRRMEELERQQDRIEAEMNAMVGFDFKPRVPPRQRPVVLAGNTVLNNIRVSNSQIGVLNTGTIGSIDNAVGLIRESGAPQVAKSLQAIAEGLAADSTLGHEKRDVALELLSGISTEAATPTPRRRTAVARALIVDLAQILSGAAATAQLWVQYGPVIEDFFRSLGA